MKFRGALVLAMWLAVEATSARESLNFYVTPPEPAAGKAADKQEKASESESNPVPKAKAQEPEPAAKPLRKATDPKRESAAEIKPATKPAAASMNLQIRSSKALKALSPPLDPFGLAQAFRTRWDFSSFLISAEEELKFRLDAARTRTMRLARAFSALSDEVETRQRNLNTAALAVYLLSRDQYSWIPVEGRNLTEAQLIAVRATMRQDIAAMQSALSDYEILRDSLNSSAEEVAAMEKNGLGAITDDLLPTDTRITVPIADVAAARTQSILEERLVSVESLKAALAAENLRSNAERRQSIASFAPPPPMGRHIERGKPLLPAGPSEEVMKHQPKGESVQEPEKTALVFETPVNAPVHAVKGGVVVYAGPFRGYGDTVIIEHEKGMFSVYSHLGNIQVMERQPIHEGSLLGRAGTPPEIGRSGIHFQVRKGKAPLKPETWLGTSEVQKLLTKY